jgi:hypothetical protein
MLGIERAQGLQLPCGLLAAHQRLANRRFDHLVRGVERDPAHQHRDGKARRDDQPPQQRMSRRRG